MIIWTRQLKRFLWQHLLLFLVLAFLIYPSWLVFSDLTDRARTLTFITSVNMKTPDSRMSHISGQHDSTHKAILLSYMRAGTTFVGSTFERNKDIFYVFEPEWDLIFHTLNEYKPLHYLDGSLRPAVWMDQGDALIRELIQNYLRCNMSGIDLRSLSQRFMSEGQYTKGFYVCVRERRNITDCVRDFTEVCQTKDMRVLKTVRLRMSVVEDLLRKDPTLKLIHMIRDPRGIAVSRMKWAEYYAVKNTFTFGRVCAEILRDIETVEQMSPELSSRVLPVLYEDVAENPEAMIKAMYDFLQITMPEYVRDYIKNVTHAEEDIRTGFSTLRKNSSKTAYSWRSKIRYSLCTEIDKMCSRVYKKTGYLPVKSRTDLGNLSISLRDPHLNNNRYRIFRTKAAAMS